METPHNDTPAEENIPKFRGLYRYVKIPVKALDCIIVACIAVIIIVVALELCNPRVTVTFDSKGGTDVVAQDKMYGDHVDLPEPPTREGYVFTGWYADENCTQRWVMDYSQVGQDTTLYAGWEAE